ncbi:MAG TPA: hypothetical protein VFP58_09600 [Candidatus Eisenbacteria bacterium]|nr:hypothetical protein [Candidatus Eisenbacteria bacterium]
MNRLILASVILAISIVPSSAAALSGPISFTAFGGLYTDPVDEFMLGAGVKLGFGGLSVTPNAEYVFVESGSYYTLNVDGTFPILPLGVASLYAGGGAGLHFLDPEVGDSNTETGINLLVGAGFNAIGLKPYGQIKYVFIDGDDPLVFMAGVRF